MSQCSDSSTPHAKLSTCKGTFSPVSVDILYHPVQIVFKNHTVAANLVTISNRQLGPHIFYFSITITEILILTQNIVFIEVWLSELVPVGTTSSNTIMTSMAELNITEVSKTKLLSQPFTFFPLLFKLELVIPIQVYIYSSP